MERLRVTCILLAGLNAAAWFLAPSFAPKVELEEIRGRLSSLENELPGLEQAASWSSKISSMMEPPPACAPNELLAEIRGVADRSHFLLSESANDGGHPARLSLAGYGPYTAGAILANRLSTDLSLKVDRVSCEIRDDGLVELKLQVLARTGPWEGQAASQERPEVERETSPNPTIGRIDLFAGEQIPAPVVERRNLRTFRYLGYFSETGTPSVILEENGRAFLGRVGEILPGGVKILSADTDDIELYHHEAGTWTVRMKSAP